MESSYGQPQERPYQGAYYANKQINREEKRSAKRAANNGFFLKEHGHQMWDSPTYEYRVSQKYENHFCPACKEAVENNTHMIIVCPKYQHIREEANNRLNNYLPRELIVDISKRLKTKTHRDAATTAIIAIIGHALHTIKKLRNDYFGSE